VTIRTFQAALIGLALVIGLGACSGGALTADQVHAELNGLFPAPNARDNTSACADAGCVQLVTSDAVSIYQWPDDATAQRWAEAMDGDPFDARQVGPFMLLWDERDERQGPTSAEARDAYTARLGELVAAG